MLAAALLTALPEILRPLATGRDIVNGAVLIAARIWLPRGLFDLRWLSRHLPAPLARLLGQ